jgi:3-hydroxyisobutyrate dehydrogenase-like beta-hydroxyacid dehydrogenase
VDPQWIMRGEGHPGHVQENKSSVTVLGLGAMGRALAGALLARGCPTTVWNRSPGKAEALAAKGAVVAATAAEAVAASRLVIVCLLDHQSVVDVLGTTSLPGRAVVNLTNGTPAQGRQLAEWVTKQQADLLDGGIMAIPPMIATPGAFLFYSGSRSVFDSYRTVLETFGEAHYVGTDPGLAALYDISLLSGMYGMFMGVAHALALISTENVPATAFAPLLTRWLVAMTGAVASTAEQMDKGDYTIGVTSTLAMQAAAYPNLTSTARDQGISAELLAPLQRVLDKRVAEGHGDDSIGGIIEILRGAAK